MDGCSNCRYCKCYPGDYWTPDDYECTSIIMETNDTKYTDDELDAIFTRVWENGEKWDSSDEEPLCPGWEEAPTLEDYYWDKYAWEENHYDKDARAE